MTLFSSSDASSQGDSSERETHFDPSTKEVLDGLLRRIANLEEQLASFQQQSEINGERRDSLEGLNRAAEMDRESHERGREDEERFRQREETQRILAEIDRQVSEEARGVAEEARQVAEQARVIAEQARAGVAELQNAARDHGWQLPEADAG